MTIGIGGHKTVGDGYANSYTTAGVSTTTGSTFVAILVSGAPFGAGSISDSNGNSYTQEVADLAIQTTYRFLNVWVCQNGTGSGSHTLTVTLGGGASNNLNVALVEITGAAVSSLDQVVKMAANGSGPASPQPGASVTTTSANELVLGIYGCSYGPQTFTGAGGSFTLGDSVTDSGTSQQLVWAYDVVSSTGTYTPSWAYTGTAGYNFSGATLSFIAVAAPANITPGAGSLALTGAAPARVAGTITTPSAGSASLAGYAPALLLGTIITAGAGSLALTGQVPGVAGGGNVNITPAAGSLSLSGGPPTVAVSSPSSLNLVGYAPTVTQGGGPTSYNITPPAGALTLTGAIPGVVTYSPSSLNLVGYAPTCTIAPPSTNIVPDAGSLTFTGYTVTQELDLPSPDTGVLLLQGYAPQITAIGAIVERYIYPDAGRIRRPQRYVVRIRGEDVIARSLAQAISMVAQEREEAEARAREAADREMVASKGKPQGKPKIEQIEAPADSHALIKQATEEANAKIREAYKSALQDAEIRYWMAVAVRKDEEEEAILLML